MIDRETAVTIARIRAEEIGWGFTELLEVLEHVTWFKKPKSFKIKIATGVEGINACFAISARTGKILSENSMIERETAVEIARKRAEEKGWIFAEPIQVLHTFGPLGKSNQFEIMTNIGFRGGNAYFTIDAETGKIISEGFSTR